MTEFHSTPSHSFWARAIKVHLFVQQIFIESHRVSWWHSSTQKKITEAKSVTKGLALVGTCHVIAQRSWQDVCPKVGSTTQNHWVPREDLVKEIGVLESRGGEGHGTSLVTPMTALSQKGNPFKPFPNGHFSLSSKWYKIIIENRAYKGCTEDTYYV